MMQRSVLVSIMLAVSFISAVLQHSEALIFNTSSLLPCSSVCESEFCSVPLFLRYGKYCGVGYTGCPGQQPCDALDACCLQHDNCIGDDLGNYINETCNKNLLDCVSAFQATGGRPFLGHTCNVGEVVSTIEIAMRIAIYIGH